MNVDANKVVDLASKQAGDLTRDFVRKVAILQAQNDALQQENTELKKQLEEKIKEAK